MNRRIDPAEFSDVTETVVGPAIRRGRGERDIRRAEAELARNGIQ